MKSINPNLYLGHNGSYKLLSVHVVTCEVAALVQYRHHNFTSCNRNFGHLLPLKNRIADMFRRLEEKLQQTFTNDYIKTGNS